MPSSSINLTLVSLPLVHRILNTILPDMRDAPQVNLSRLDTDVPAGPMSPFLKSRGVAGKENRDLFPENVPGRKWIFVTCWPKRELVAEVPSLDLQDLEGRAAGGHCTVFFLSRKTHVP